MLAFLFLDSSFYVFLNCCFGACPWFMDASELGQPLRQSTCTAFKLGLGHFACNFGLKMPISNLNRPAHFSPDREFMKLWERIFRA